MLTLIGCGNPNRSDDGVGVVIAKRLAERLRRHPVAGVRVFDCGTAGMDVMFKARGSDALVLIDACRSGAEPGTVFNVPACEIQNAHNPGYSLHDFRWDHALYAGRRIFGHDFPSDVWVWLIEAASLELGFVLSRSVLRASETVFESCLDQIAEYASARDLTETTLNVDIHRGALGLSAEAYKRYFGKRDGALVMTQEDALCLIPVDLAHGGLLVKQRNARGDRSIDVSEFLRKLDWSTELDLMCSGRWDDAIGGLVIRSPVPHEVNP